MESVRELPVEATDENIHRSKLMKDASTKIDTKKANPNTVTMIPKNSVN